MNQELGWGLFMKKIGVEHLMLGHLYCWDHEKISQTVTYCNYPHLYEKQDGRPELGGYPLLQN
jgi:hypothetical protein